MFKHILLPTDGSPLSDLALDKAVAMAAGFGAKLTGLHVMLPFNVMNFHAEAMQRSSAELILRARQQADTILSNVAGRAGRSGVPCETVAVENDHPYAAIIDLATERGCDLIVMASHGRRGVKALLLGSETHKVLTHSHIPVLVFRPMP